MICYNHLMKYGLSDEQIDQIKKWLGTGSINIFGLPFSGKDTQGARLSKLLDAPLIGGGDIIRASKNKKLKEYIDKGYLVPQDEYIEIVRPFLEKKEYMGKPLVLSSVGRWRGEQKGVMTATQQSNHPFRVVILLKVTETEAKKRLDIAKKKKDRGARIDDSKTALHIRFQEFKHKTQPVINFYKNVGFLQEVNGNLDEDSVTKEILTVLLKLSSN